MNGWSPCTSRTGTERSDTKKQVPVGSGMIPIADIIAAAPSALRVVELDDSEGDLLDAVRVSREFLISNYPVVGMSGSGPLGVGIIGAGTISGTYLENLTSFPDTEVVAIGDLFTDVGAKQSRRIRHRRPRATWPACWSTRGSNWSST